VRARIFVVGLPPDFKKGLLQCREDDGLLDFDEPGEVPLGGGSAFSDGY
jgi:hypothetical protein